MGADLFFKAKNRSEVKKINDFLLKECKLNKELEEKFGTLVYLYDDEDIKIAKEQKNNYMVEFFKKYYGTGDVRVSIDTDGKEEEFLELLTKIFEELNKRFDILYYANSCAFTTEEYYFTKEQMQRITNYGEKLSGKNEPKYKKLKEFLKRD